MAMSMDIFYISRNRILNNNDYYNNRHLDIIHTGKDNGTAPVIRPFHVEVKWHSAKMFICIQEDCNIGI